VSALAGLWRFDGKPQVDGDCARMLAAQQLYGPDDGRQWSDSTLAMGRRLFRTLPEDVYDRQPLQSRDGRLTLVADVRLDNREDLVTELGLPLAEARQLCDAAILLESLDRWGEQALTRLVGDFAFVLWDAPAQRLLLARDFIGQRPLHYHCGRGFFAFASMPKGLHALAEVPYGPDEQLVAEFVVLMPRRGPRSFFRDIARVEPAHIVTVTRNGVSSRCYWQPQRPRGTRLRSSDYVEGLRHHLDQSTQSRLRGVNGAVATHLSAGLDSSAVTATAARLLHSRGGKVVAFTAVPRVGYDGPNVRKLLGNEGPLAAATAAMYPNVEHVLIRSGHNSPLDGLDRGFYLCERPTLNPCNRVWLSAINQAARERELNILLIGTMGNMSISYGGLELLPELLLSGRLIRLWREAKRLREKPGMRWLRVLVNTFGPFMPLWLWQWVERKVLDQLSNVLDYTAIRADCLAERNLAALARERDLDFHYRPWKDGFAMRLWVMSRIDNADVYKGMLAGWGSDWRAPLADKRMVEYCLSIPTDQYLSNGVLSALARHALSDRLPAAVLNEPKQGYQAADWHEGLTAARAEVAAELDRLAACAPAAKTLDIARMKNLIENLPTSGWERIDVEDRYRLALLRGISAGHFLRKATGAN
jgi:asparagine synthase (glutamine-hydrolysing)